jgi:hypothetical protein
MSIYNNIRIAEAEEFYNAWEFLMEHKMFKHHFRDVLYIMTAKVNPETGKIDDDVSKNTKVKIWLEVGPWSEQYHTHDFDLDCGGDTFEEAISKLACLVRQYYTEEGIKKNSVYGNLLLEEELDE